MWWYFLERINETGGSGLTDIAIGSLGGGGYKVLALGVINKLIIVSIVGYIGIEANIHYHPYTCVNYYFNK